MHNILVTGGAGFIGANFVQYLLAEKKDCKVIVLDALTYAGNLYNLKPVMDLSTWLSAAKWTIVSIP